MFLALHPTRWLPWATAALAAAAVLFEALSLRHRRQSERPVLTVTTAMDGQFAVVTLHCNQAATRSYRAHSIYLTPAGSVTAPPTTAVHDGGEVWPGQSREVGRVLARAYEAHTVQAVVHVPFIDRTGVVRSKPFTVPGSF